MKGLFLFIFSGLSFCAHAQVPAFAREIVDTLSSSAFWGRGYTRNGMHNAAGFLADQFKEIGLKPLNGSSFGQGFSYPANTFPGKMELRIDGVVLEPGVDFIVAPESKGIKARGNLIKIDSLHFADPQHNFVIELKDKLTWSVATEQAGYAMVQVNRHRVPSASSYHVRIDADFEPNFKADNICGMVPGTEKPDSFLFITAHYDHLGGMGKHVFFPGANDNASGVALLLQLAKYYAAHPAKYSMGFICFAGEEAGLIGSKYFVQHPLIPLSHIRFLINTDLAGTGEDGITVVNATEFPHAFSLMQSVNTDFHLLKAVNARGKAANSDHYFFTEAGVPSFFFYTLGGIQAYHDVYDKAATLPLNEQADLVSLIVQFYKRLLAK
ncbi:MAG: M28 family peptidase [Chitinophagaceae bacterium]|nr:M28 family peptidase [Bacteroidota bacterium]MCC6259130.1 M28 family peptidase [Chitinophagaceae bacterium]MCW5916932.1 M28 family peptidase [Ferruginibacter sp.]